MMNRLIEVGKGLKNYMFFIFVAWNTASFKQYPSFKQPSTHYLRTVLPNTEVYVF